MDDAAIIEEMRRICAAPKVAGDPAGWAPGNGDALVLTLPIETSEPVQSTTWIAWRTVRKALERDVSATLITTYRGKDYITWRMDWRPAQPHLNKYGPKGVRGVNVHTGIHDFALNAQLGLISMQTKNLPICIPVDQEPHNFGAFVRFVCDRLDVTLTEQILSPPWSSTLF